jgi:integrase
VDFKGPDGLRLRVSTGETDKTKADLKAAELVAAAHRSAAKRPAKGARKITNFGQLLTYVERHLWEKQRGYKNMKHSVTHLVNKLGELPLEQISYAVLSDYCAERSAEGEANATLNRRMSVASRALREAERMGWLQTGPRVPRFRPAAIKDRYVTEGEESRLMNAISSHCSTDRPEWQYLFSFVPFLLDTGLRMGEARSLTFANWKPSTDMAATLVAGQKSKETTALLKEATRIVDSVPKGKKQPGAVVLTHGTTKSGKGRHVPLTPRAEAALLLMLTSKVHLTVREDGIRHRFERACKESGISGVTIHTLRHTCASRLVQKGVDLYRVQRWLGHSSPTLTMRYSHLRDDDLADAALALAG